MGIEGLRGSIVLVVMRRVLRGVVGHEGEVGERMMADGGRRKAHSRKRKLACSNPLFVSVHCLPSESGIS